MKDRIVHEMNSALSSLSLALDTLDDEELVVMAPTIKKRINKLKDCWQSYRNFVS